MRRSLIRVGQEMIDVAYDAPVDFAPRKQIEDTERKLYKLAEPGDQHSGFQSFGRTLAAAVDMAASAVQRDGNLSGIATGLAELDSMIGGLQPSDLIILACAYRKPKSGHNGDEARLGSRVN